MCYQAAFMHETNEALSSVAARPDGANDAVFNRISEQFERALQAIAASTELQARFLNTLSLLEYVGARKILKSQPEATVSFDLLGHAGEELRHARTLKGVAERMNARISAYGAEETLCPAQALAYFHGVDDAVAAQWPAGPSRLNYLYVTALVEERVLWVYPMIREALPSEDVQRALRGILAEEIRHLTAVTAEIASSDPQHRERFAALRAVETDLFGAFAESLHRATA
jgi:hypothetical protein